MRQFAALTDLFGIATQAAGKTDLRQGVDVLGVLDGKAQPRENLFGYYGEPGTPLFKIMVRNGPWKYIFMANAGSRTVVQPARRSSGIEQRRDCAVGDRE